MAIDNTQPGQTNQKGQQSQQPRSDKQADRSDRSSSRSDRNSNFDQQQPERETPDVKADQSKAWDQKQRDMSSSSGSSSNKH